MDLGTIGKTPISEDYPAGKDIRHEPVFDELQAEIMILGSPSAKRGVNWQRVSSLAEKILSEKSKDLLVGSYFAVSQIYIAGVAGLATGLQVYHELLEIYWDTMFPKKKRMRGRVAAIEWWIEKSAIALNRLKSIEEPRKVSLLAECDHLEQLFKELLPKKLFPEDHPLTLGLLTRVIKSLPVKKETVKTPSPEQEKAPEKKNEPTAETQSPATVEKRSSPAPKPEVQQLVGSSDEAVKAIQTSNENIKRAALGLVDHDLANPLGHRSLRTAIWSNLDSLPQAIEGKTIIPPPEPHIITTLQDLTSRGDWINLTSAAESHFAQYIFWLDLQRYCATGLENLGPPYAKAYEAVCQETATLLHRMPGLSNLQFANGSPFADEETQEWCQSLGSGGSSMDLASNFVVAEGTTEEVNQLNNAIQQAGEFIKERKLIDAVKLLQKGIQEAHSARESMQWRLALVQILIGGKKAEMALSHCEKLAEELERYKLECWDPAQALVVYKTYYHCLKTISSKMFKERGRELLDKISRLDPAEAIRITL